jgi:antitoxin MazE
LKFAPRRIYFGYTSEIVVQIQIAKWGNSLGLRVPRDLAMKLGLREGSRVEIEARGNDLVVTKSRRRFTLDELLAGMTPDRAHPVAEDPPKGSEFL